MAATKDQRPGSTEDGRAPGEVEIHDLHPLDTAVVRVEATVTGLQAVIPDGLREVATAMAAAGVELAGPPFTRYLDWGPERAVVEVGFPVWRAAPQVGRVGPGRLPGGRVASIIHVGPYDAIDHAYAHLRTWLSSRGHGETGPMWEVYWSDPETDPNPAGWRTEILVPVD